MMVVEERRSEAEGVGDGRGWLVFGRRRRRWTCSAAETDAVKKPQHGLVDHHHCARTTSQLQDQVRHYDRLLSCFCSSGGITSSGCPSVFACVRACVRSWHSPTGLPSTSSSFLTQFITFIPHTRIGRIHIRQSTLLFTHLGSSLPSFISYHFYHLSLFCLQNQSFLIFFQP